MTKFARCTYALNAIWPTLRGWVR